MEILPLTPENKICFFGYYDKKQLSHDKKYFLFLEVEFQNREPLENDKAEIWIGEIGTKKYQKLDETYSWNFQQGCMLSWLSEQEIIYNVRIEKEFFAKIYNIKNGKTKIVDRPISCIFPEKKIALSLNFSRLAKWRPGYGYVGVKDRYENEKWPEDDGIYFVNIEKNKCKLIIPLSKMLEFRKEEEINNSYGWFNHTLFNKNGTRFCFVNRWKTKFEEQFKTRFITSDLYGKEIYDLIDSYSISHFDWKDEKEIIVWAEIKGEKGFWILKDKTGKIKKLSEKIQEIDGHCSYSKNKKFILYDTYPIENYRYLKIFDIEKNREVIIGKFYSLPEITGPIRCDLHPRWENENIITFDSIHENYRRSYLLKLNLQFKFLSK
ncbi:MAG: hypothetical protein NC917_01675 [Candidatus Omnitrophica bacterium]|nr:hypothetical protein [Candidatus Omnitrophota bacterium]MCM8810341.1 hypothetical protein [Candidatus Omnitrophota bacterium]